MIGTFTITDSTHDYQTARIFLLKRLDTAMLQVMSAASIVEKPPAAATCFPWTVRPLFTERSAGTAPHMHTGAPHSARVML